MDKFKTHHKNPYVIDTEVDEDAIVLNPNDRYNYNFNETEIITSQIYGGIPESEEKKLPCRVDYIKELGNWIRRIR